jgi:hypothetical protein
MSVMWAINVFTNSQTFTLSRTAFASTTASLALGTCFAGTTTSITGT